MSRGTRVSRGAVAAVAALALALSMVPTTAAIAAPGDGTIRTFDDEPVGAPPAGCTVVGDVTVAEAAFGGAAAGNRALRVNDQSTTVNTRARCTDPLSAEKSVSLRIAPTQLAGGMIVAVMGGAGSSGNGVWRFLLSVEGADLRVQTYNGTAWVHVAQIPGAATLREWNDLTINATTDRAELVIDGVRYQTRVRVAPSAQLGDLYFSGPGTAPAGIDFSVDDIATSGELPETAFAGVALQTVFDDKGLARGDEVVDAPVARFQLPEGADPAGYSAAVDYRGTAIPAEVSGPDADGWVTVAITHTFAEAGSGSLRTAVTDAAGVVSGSVQAITIPAFKQVLVATAPAGTQIRFPDIVKLQDGRLFVVYHEASGHTNANGIIKATASSDAGETWTPPVTIVDIPHDARDPKIAELSDGTLLLTYFETAWTTPSTTQPFIVRSTDGGTTWSQPRLVENPMSSPTDRADGWAATHAPIVELENGDLLMPLYGTMQGDERQRATIVRSTDGGLTWDADGMVTLAVGDIHFQEPNLTVLPSGEIVALIRTTAVPTSAYLTRSFDDGHTWTEPVATDIPAHSHHQLLTSDGRLLLTYGNPDVPRRPTFGVLIENPSLDWDGYAEDAVLLYDAPNGDQANPSSEELEPGQYITLGYNVSARTLTAVFTDTADYRPVDGAAKAPARGVLSSDEGHDTGLSDGNFTLSMDLWWGENASLVRLYRDGDLIAVEKPAVSSPNAQHVEVAVSGLPNGSYEFTAELINSKGSSETRPLTVTVKHASPGKPVLSHDNHDKDGSYTVTANMWWGTNATSYTFYENGVAVASGELAAASPNPQVATLPVAGKAPGTYTYLVEFSNAAGSTSSKKITVTVEG